MYPFSWNPEWEKRLLVFGMGNAGQAFTSGSTAVSSVMKEARMKWQMQKCNIWCCQYDSSWQKVPPCHKPGVCISNRWRKKSWTFQRRRETLSLKCTAFLLASKMRNQAMGTVEEWGFYMFREMSKAAGDRLQLIVLQGKDGKGLTSIGLAPSHTDSWGMLSMLE